MTSRATRSHTISALVLLVGGISLSAGCRQTDTGAERENRIPPVFSFDQTEFPGGKPWTAKEFQNVPEEFQFAVIGDRTGGADARGVFVRAMDQLNLLQPEFVINVGDLIEGYSQGPAELNAMWDEADAIVGKLEMPSFRTVGNHDMSNEAAKEVWLERFGRTYYHFVYRDVLFVVLNSDEIPRPAPPEMGEKIELYNKLQTEDPRKAMAMLEEFIKDESVVAALGKPVDFGDEQIDYVKEVLAQNPDARWTFLFLHEPAWENPSEDFLAVERDLQGRDYTFLAGHLHYYDLKQCNGRDYITMGPAGASFHHDGPGGC